MTEGVRVVIRAPKQTPVKMLYTHRYLRFKSQARGYKHLNRVAIRVSKLLSAEFEFSIQYISAPGNDSVIYTDEYNRY
ncbi:MAG TPA: hypothetical protein VN081_05130 [Dongiaceae bacterium]|nr:hypothetical protein [Dongiaceae bacterium]